MTKAKKYPLLLIYLIFNLNCLSQIKIVKDNITCKYGLKHSSGEWIKKPEYDLISVTSYPNRQYLLLKNNKYSLADSDGTLLSPKEYDKIQGVINNLDHYWIYENNTVGIMDSKGHIVIETGKYEWIKTLNSDFYIAGFNKNKGKYLLQNGNLITKKPVDLITSTGDYIVLKKGSKKKYSDYVLNAKNIDTLFIIENGYFQNDGKYQQIVYADSTQLFENCKYLVTLKKPNAYYNDVLYPQNITSKKLEISKRFYRYVQNNKIGVASVSGEILAEPQFTRFELNSISHPNIFYLIGLGSKSGYMSEDFKITVEPKFTLLLHHHIDGMIILNHENKIGLYNFKGEQLSDFKFQLLSDNYLNFLVDPSDIFLVNNNYKDITDTTLYKHKLIKGEYLLKLGNSELYKFNNQYFTFYRSDYSYTIALDSRVEFRDNEYILYKNHQKLHYDLNGKSISKTQPVEKINIPSFKLNEEYSIGKQKNYFGILNSNQEWVVAPEYFLITPCNSNSNLVWAKKQNTNSSRFSDPLAGDWKLINTDGTLYSDYTFDIPVSTFGVSPVYINDKCGVYDFQLNKFIIEPNYNYINPNFGPHNHQILFDENLDFYVLRDFQTFVTNDKWKYVVQVNRHSSDLNLNIAGLNSFYWVFMNESDTMALSTAGDTTTNSKVIYKLLHQGNITNAQDASNNHLGINYIYYANPNHYPDVLNEVIDFLIKKENIDFKFKPLLAQIYTGIRLKNLNADLQTRFQTNDYKNPNYISKKVNYVNDNFVSLQNIGYNPVTYHSDRDPIKYRNLNLYRSYGYLFEFKLKDLFRNDVNLEDAMILLLTDAIYNREDLDLDCHNPQTIFDRTGSDFYFDEKGIYLPIINKDGIMIDLIIPWMKLKKYAPENGIVTNMIKYSEEK